MRKAAEGLAPRRRHAPRKTVKAAGLLCTTRAERVSLPTRGHGPSVSEPRRCFWRPWCVKGEYSYDWVSGPNPGYSFGSSRYPA